MATKSKYRYAVTYESGNVDETFDSLDEAKEYASDCGDEGGLVVEMRPLYKIAAKKNNLEPVQ